MKFICVEMQGFSTPDFEPKELTIITSTGQVYHYLFKNDVLFWMLPTKYQQTISWLERHYHGIKYGSKGIEFNPGIFTEFEAETVYTKGAEKAKFLLKYFPNVVNLEHLDDCPKYEKTWNYCTYHKEDSKWNCSCVNVKILFKYVIN